MMPVDGCILLVAASNDWTTWECVCDVCVDVRIVFGLFLLLVV